MVVFLTSRSPVVDYQPTLWTEIFDGEGIGFVLPDGRLSFPTAPEGFNGDEMTVSELSVKAALQSANARNFYTRQALCPNTLSKEFSERLNKMSPTGLAYLMIASNSEFDEWYSAEYTRVLAATAAATNSLERAEDATNDAFVKALERWDEVGSMESPTGWAIVVALNNVKRAGRRNRTSLTPVNVGTIDERLDRVAGLELWKALDSLPTRQRHAMILRYANDLTQREVARELGVSPGTVAATLNHARAKLRGYLLERDREQ